jgi:hypothetical protein
MRKLPKRDIPAAARELANSVSDSFATEKAARTAWGKAYAEWVDGGCVGTRPPKTFAKVVTADAPAAWVSVTFPGQRRDPGDLLPRLRSAREVRTLKLAMEGRKARNAKRGQRKGAEKARAAKQEKLAAPPAVAKARRMVAAIRDAIRDGESDRAIVRMMKARGYAVGREKVAEIRAGTRRGGLA